MKGKVKFKGNHCFGNCSDGPILKIDDRIYKHVTEDGIIGTLEKELGKV